MLYMFENLIALGQSVKSDSLFAVGVDFYQANNYKKAIEFFAESDKLDKAELDTMNVRRHYSNIWIASCYFKMGKEQKARSIDSIYYSFPPIDRRRTVKIDSLYTRGLEFFEKKTFEDALNVFKQSLSLSHSMFGEETIYYYSHFASLAMCCANLEKYEDVLKWCSEYISVIKKYDIKGNRNTAVIMYLRGSARFHLNDFDSAIDDQKKALQILDSIGCDKIDYASNLTCLAVYYAAKSNYDEAIKYTSEAKNIYNHYDKSKKNYAISLNNLGAYYEKKGQYKEAIQLFQEALPLIDKNNIQYIVATLNILAETYIKIEKMEEAFRFVNEAIKIIKQENVDMQSEHINSLYILSSYYYSKGEIPEAMKLCSKALKIANKTGDNQKWKLLSAWERYSSEFGTNSQTFNFHEVSLQSAEAEYGKESLEYVSCLNSYTEYCIQKDEILKALRMASDALLICRKIFPEGHPYMISILRNISTCYTLRGKITEAIYYSSESVKMAEITVGKKHSMYIASLLGLANDTYMKGRHIYANHLYTEVLSLLKNSNDKRLQFSCLLPILVHYYLAGDKHELGRLIDKLIEVGYDVLHDIMTGQTEELRNRYWGTNSDIFEQMLQMFTYAYPNSAITSSGYNAILLSKGQLLNMSKDLLELITNSKDSTLLAQYNKVKSNHLMLQRFYGGIIVDTTLNIDSLETVTQEMEWELMQRSKIYGDYVKNIRINWKNVQHKLGNKDVAVEFVSFKLNKDSTMYIAYVLKKGMTSPKLVKLFEEKQLKKNSLYSTHEASKMIWEPLSEYLIGVDTVYFAPSGELYNIAIETLPHWSEDCFMSEKWEIYRLSSTRELALAKKKNEIKSAVVYGAIKYSTKKEVIVEESSNIHKKGNVVFNTQNQVAGSNNLRVSVEELPETKKEVMVIDKALKKMGLKVELRIDTIATERDFKNLSGKKTGLLHITTHGFYWSEEEAKKYDNLSFLMLGDRYPRYVEDKALARSGLYFAGANNSLRDGKIPEDMDDGILTAKEISKLDLQGADLVVLSACQTGLGEIKGDGVFGLQRGFKKAGAQSILMSLWEVDIDATTLLMTQFYKNLAEGKGMSKHRALKQAQKFVRDYKIGAVRKYKDPYYWASFILLDAID